MGGAETKIKDTDYIDYLNHGLNFLQSANVLNQNVDKLGTHKFASIYFCVTHSYELLFKALLLSQGCSRSELTKIDVRHNLCALLEKAKENGLVLSSEFEHEVLELNKYTVKHEFRYPIEGEKFIRDTQLLIEVGKSIHTQVSELIKKVK